MKINAIIIFLLVILISLICVYSINLQTPEYFDNIAYEKIPKMSNEQDKQLQKLLKLVHDVFVKNNIQYSMSGGTMLGAIRHKNRIPWDDDADIFAFDKDEEKIKNIEWEKYGCKIISHWIGYKVYFINGTKAIENKKEQEWNFPFVDIFIFGKIGDKYTHTREKCRKYWKDDYMYENEIFPLKMYKFGDIALYGVNKPYTYLTRYYKPGWETSAQIWLSHILGEHIKKVNFYISDYAKFNDQPKINYLWVYDTGDSINNSVNKEDIINYFMNDHIIVFVDDSTIKSHLPNINLKKITNKYDTIKKELLEKHGGKFFMLEKFFKN